MLDLNTFRNTGIVRLEEYYKKVKCPVLFLEYMHSPV